MPSSTRDCMVERLSGDYPPTSSTDGDLFETRGICDGQLKLDQSSIGVLLLRSTCFHTYDPCKSSTSVGIQWDNSYTKRLFIASLHLYSLAGPSDEADNCNGTLICSDTAFNSEEELTAFHAKMAQMQALLENELEELHEQEINLVVNRIEEDAFIRQKMMEMEKVLKQEKRDLEDQERILEIERDMNLRYPEPQVTRPTEESSDDSFTRAMKRVGGLIYESKDMVSRLLTYNDLPPPLSLSELMSSAASSTLH